jgi:hypothetical protein
MEFNTLKTVTIPDRVKDHQLVLRSFIEETNGYTYFQTILKIVETDGIMLESTPTYSWRKAKREYKEILSKVSELEYIDITPRQAYLLNKQNAI